MPDLYTAARTAFRNPGFSAVVVGTLALGIGANTAIFSVIRAVLLDPLPYRDAGRLVMVWEDASNIGFPENTPAPANYADWKAQNTVFEGMAALSDRSYNLTGDGEPERVQGRQVTADLFPVLGVTPVVGRGFTAADDRPGAPRTAVISHQLWRERFGGSPSIAGRKILLDSEPHIVVGVMPAGFDFPDPGTSVWTPIAFTAEQLARRQSHYLRVIARLRPGVSIERARGDMDTIAKRLQRDYPASNRNVGVRLNPLRDQLVGRTATALALLWSVAGAVLLIACANIANLLLARAVKRRKEIGVRIALGAGRARLIRQLLTESFLLCAPGAAIGLLLASWCVDFLVLLIPAELTSAAPRIDAGIAAWASLLCVITTVLFGALPARQAWRFGSAEALNQGARSGEHRSANRLRMLLVVSQTALAAMLLVSCGLALRSFANLRAVDPGFRAANVLTMRTALSAQVHRDLPRRNAFYAQVLERVQALPGVAHAGYTTWLPYRNFGGTTAFLIEGKPAPRQGEHNDANVRLVSRGYFPALGMTLVRGRFLTDADAAPAPRAIVINETMARKFWPGEDPLGARIQGCGDCPWMTVAGIARDLHQKSLDTEPRPEWFVHYSHLGFFAPQDLAIRAHGDPAALTAAVRKAIREVDPRQPVANVKLLSEYLDEDLAPRRFQSQLLGAFAALAAVLAALGIYGVLAYLVAQRKREIGVRLALGAPPRHVMGLVLAQGLRPAAAGLAAGLGAAFVLSRLIEGLLFGVQPRDTATFAGSAATLFLIALLACWLPARLASRINPTSALHHE